MPLPCKASLLLVLIIRVLFILITVGEKECISEQGGKGTLGTHLLWGGLAVKVEVAFGQRVVHLPLC